VVAAFDVELGVLELVGPDEAVEPEELEPEVVAPDVVVDGVEVDVFEVDGFEVAPALTGVAAVDAFFEVAAPGTSPATTTPTAAVAPAARRATARDVRRTRRTAAVRALGLWWRGSGDIGSLRSGPLGGSGIQAGGTWPRPRPG
jgi:hypothetical protein